MRWKFSDMVGLTVYDMEIGPSQGVDIQFSQSLGFNFMPTATDTAVAMRTSQSPTEGTIQGTLLSQAEYDALIGWWQHADTVLIVDHLGREFQVMIEDFDPKRVKNATNPWKHTWSMRFTIFDVTNPAPFVSSGIPDDVDPFVIDGGATNTVFLYSISGGGVGDSIDFLEVDAGSGGSP